MIRLATNPRSALETPESKKLLSKFSDRARKSTRVGNQFLIPHKFTPTGEILDESNFDPKRDLSRLTLDDFRLLSTLQDKKWDKKAACELLGIDLEKAKHRLKKLSYFEFEDEKSQALASVATAAFVAAKNIEGFYADNLSDGQRDHLKELAKIAGAYKTKTELTVTHTLNVPKLDPEAWEAIRKIADLQADVIDAEVA